jgi:phosphohistidine phosphatase SixA
MKSSRTIRRLTRALSRLIATSCIMVLLSAAGGNIEANALSAPDSAKVTTVFLVRHAEKEASSSDNPPLTADGMARSNELARILAQAGITAIFTSQYLRTKQTADPLAKQQKITPVEMPIGKKLSPQDFNSYIKGITDKIHERAGEAVLVVGHSNTVPPVIKMLGVDTPPVIDENKEFDSLFIVMVFANGKAKLVHLKYGKAN